jgi:hypothetical protein
MPQRPPDNLSAQRGALCPAEPKGAWGQRHHLHCSPSAHPTGEQMSICHMPGSRGHMVGPHLHSFPNRGLGHQESGANPTRATHLTTKDADVVVSLAPVTATGRNVTFPQQDLQPAPGEGLACGQLSGTAQAHADQPRLQNLFSCLQHWVLGAGYLSLSMQWSRLSVTSISQPCWWRFIRAALSTCGQETQGHLLQITPKKVLSHKGDATPHTDRPTFIT